MTTTPPTTPSPTSKLGNQIDAAVKPKVSLRIWVILAIAAGANLVGVFLHF